MILLAHRRIAVDPDYDNPGDLTCDEVHRSDPEPGIPGETPDSPAVQGNPVGPPD